MTFFCLHYNLYVHLHIYNYITLEEQRIYILIKTMRQKKIRLKLIYHVYITDKTHLKDKRQKMKSA